MSTPVGEIHFISDCHIARRIDDTFRVYIDESEYQKGVLKVKLGRMQNDARGNAIKFASVEEADNWVKGGKIIHPEVRLGIKR
jgi:hypothetical protein